MVRQPGRDHGGIRGLVRLIWDHGEALEYDLIERGLRLRDVGQPAFTWRDLRIIVRYLPRESALVNELDPDAAGWSLESLLLATVADGIHWLQWAKTKDGQKGRHQPKPIPRPGVEDNTKKYKGTPEPVNDIVDWLGPGFEKFALAA